MTGRLTRDAASVAIVAAATLVIRIPIPVTQGYINLGDAALFVCAILWGPRSGALAGGLGSAMADILGGYAFWAPFTMVIKGTEGFLVGALSGRPAGGNGLRSLAAVTAGGVAMVAGYFFAEWWLYGWPAALVSWGANALQAGGGVVAATAVLQVLTRRSRRN